jgi:hypothetical protein
MSGAVHDGAPAPALPRGTAALIGSLVVASGLLLVLGNGSIGLAFAPLAGFLFLYAVWTLPLRATVLTLLAVALTVDVPTERPAVGQWRSPLYPVGSLLFDNLNNVLGVAALRFSGLDALIVLLVSIVVARSVGRYAADEARQTPPANVLTAALLLAFATVVWLEGWGIARGGDVKQSLWQIRPLLWLPVLAALFTHALRGPGDFAVVARIVVGAACVKTALGLYFFHVVFVAGSVDAHPFYATTHSDSVLFAAAVAACVAAWVHRPSRRNLALNLTVTPWILTGVVINNRRIAFVGLLAALWVIYAVLHPGRVRRTITAGLLLASPVIALYLAAGRNHTSGVFAPAGKIASVFRQRDASSGTRDIENYNLIMTLKPNRLLGSGFGHEYRELSKAYDISQYFAQYKYIAHNSVLWLWSVAGLAGFTAIWMMLATVVFLARRAYYFARSPDERAGAAWVLAVIAIWLVQAWGDMGMNGWVVVFILSSALAVASRLAVATGAWPAGVRLVGTARAVPPAPLAGAGGEASS